MSAAPVVGLDLSLTSSGIAVVDPVSGDVQVARLRPPSRGHLRMDYLLERVVAWCSGAALVVLEGPAYGMQSRQSGHHERAGLWWLVAHQLWRDGQPLAVCPPTSRAKYATGKGNADKDTVLLAVARRYPDVAVDGNDTADAVVMCAMGARHLGHPLEPSLPLTHLDAMSGVEWPEMKPP